MIFIKPTSHQYQICDPNSTDVRTGAKGFIEHIKELIEENNIEIIADEWSNDATVRWGKKSNMKKVAEDKHIPYIEIDMIPEMLNVSVKMARHPKYFNKRHKYWYSKIERHLGKNILIICGNNHISTSSEYDERINFFDNFLREKGVQLTEL